MRLALEDCDRRVRSLASDRLALSARLEQLQRELTADIPARPSWELLDELKFYRARFLDLRQELLGTDSAESLSTGLPELEQAVQQLRRRVELETSLQGEAVIRPVDSTRLDLLQPLENFVQAALAGTETDLIRAIAVLQSLRQLVEAKHLSDSDWEQAQQVVTRELGKDLAIAAVRGRLTCE